MALLLRNHWHGQTEIASLGPDYNKLDQLEYDPTVEYAQSERDNYEDKPVKAEPTISDNLSQALNETWSSSPEGKDRDDSNDSENQKRGPVGKGLGEGGQGYWELAGRRFISGYTIKDTKEEGTVVLDFIVDRFGNVISAEWSRQSNTTSTYLTNKAIDAVMRYKFSEKSDAPEEQKGRITFVFKLL